ncbi:transposase [Candidatus Dependentiae bacterium]|nr:transposase [Candidatus Dependentiae bacterium]
MNSLQNKGNKIFKIDFQDENVTSFGGLALAERLGNRLSLWNYLIQNLQERKGNYSWLTIIKSVIMGLLSGSFGTYAAEELREDEALKKLLGLKEIPEEVTVWRALEGLGSEELQKVLADANLLLNKKIFSRIKVSDLLLEGFIPFWGDGSVLEGSNRREGTKYIEGKGYGVLWTTLFIGPLLFAEQLCKQGDGETTAFKNLFGYVNENFLKSNPLRNKILVMLDSLNGDGPTLDMLETEKMKYVVGANKLSQVQSILESQMIWKELGGNKRDRIVESALCICSIQCAGWDKKRTLIGYRKKLTGEMFYRYSGIMTNLNESDVDHIKTVNTFVEKIFHLYSLKSGLENHYKSALSDLDLHHPPCREYSRNAGFYSLGTLAYTLARGVELIGTADTKDDKESGRIRIWRLRRRIFAAACRVVSHARRIALTFLTSSRKIEEEFWRLWNNIAQC